MSTRLAQNGPSNVPLTASCNIASPSPVPRRRRDAARPFAPADLSRKKAPQPDRRVQDERNSDVTEDSDVILLRLPEVKAMTGLSKSSLYALVREGTFPAPVRLGPRAVAWVKSEVRQWAVERVRESRAVA
jgi:predicted DNA-binding transcriptional regulator AlpA